MHARGDRTAVNTPHPLHGDKPQKILGGALWLGLAALLVYLSH